MKIKEIKIEDFKGIKELHISDLGSVNFFIGKNNCGKTSILESLNSFFSDSYFSTGLLAPPSVIHYDKSGKEHGETQISILFELPKDFYGHIKEINSDERHLLEVKYGLKIWITKHRFSDEQGQHPEKIYVNYRIENNPGKRIDRKKFDKFILDKVRGHYSGKEKVRFVGSIDGLRLEPDMNNYYNIYSGQGGETLELRQSMIKIFNKLRTHLNSNDRYLTEDFLKRIKNFSPKEFSNLFIRDQENAVVEFGGRENLRSMPYYNQGDGEIDALELLWGFDALSFPDNASNSCTLYIMDEPENHKHASLQRKLLDRIINLGKEERQFFICTHSPVFTSRYRESGVYLVTRNIDSDVNQAKLVLNPSSTAELKRELGLLNIDNFFSNAILFIEGTTEAQVIPSLLRFYDKDESSLGLKIHSVGGNDKINFNRLKETLMILEDTYIMPFIVLDKENRAERNRTDIIKSYPNLFKRKEVQYYLWNDKFFVNTLPQRIVLDAFNKLLKEKDSKKEITSKDLEVTRKRGGKIEDLFDKVCYEELETKLDKTTLGKYIAEKIDELGEEDKEEFSKNEVFACIRKIIEFVDKLNKA